MYIIEDVILITNCLKYKGTLVLKCLPCFINVNWVLSRIASNPIAAVAL